MNKYVKSTSTGETWIRSNKLFFVNEFNSNPMIVYEEEEIVDFGNGKVIKNPIYPFKSAKEEFTSENLETKFKIYDAMSGEDTGKSMKYEDVYNMLYSLYMHIAEERDSQLT